MSIQSVLFSYSGRINRFEFWIKGIVVGFALSVLLTIVASYLPGIVGYIAELAIVVAYVWMYFAIETKRLHDRGRSGWFGLVTFIPLIGGLWIIVECGFMESELWENAYGPKP